MNSWNNTAIKAPPKGKSPYIHMYFRPFMFLKNDIKRHVVIPIAGFKQASLFSGGATIIIAATYADAMMKVIIAGSLLSLVFSSVCVRYRKAKKKAPRVSEKHAYTKYLGLSS